jgi:hypothetical protein
VMRSRMRVSRHQPDREPSPLLHLSKPCYTNAIDGTPKHRQKVVPVTFSPPGQNALTRDSTDGGPVLTGQVATAVRFRESGHDCYRYQQTDKKLFATTR